MLQLTLRFFLSISSSRCSTEETFCSTHWAFFKYWHLKRHFSPLISGFLSQMSSIGKMAECFSKWAHCVKMLSREMSTRSWPEIVSHVCTFQKLQLCSEKSTLQFAMAFSNFCCSKSSIFSYSRWCRLLVVKVISCCCSSFLFISSSGDCTILWGKKWGEKDHYWLLFFCGLFLLASLLTVIDRSILFFFCRLSALNKVWCRLWKVSAIVR